MFTIPLGSSSLGKVSVKLLIINSGKMEGEQREKLPRKSHFLETIHFSNNKEIKLKEQRLLLSVFVMGFKKSDMENRHKMRGGG